MTGKEDFDVVIIGSGVAGLVCGCYLQKAGLKVAILEARDEAGGGRMAHELMRPGFPVQPCIWSEMDYLMPHQLNLELDRYGYQEIEMSAPDWGWGYTFKDETCLMYHREDQRKTAEKVKQFSEKDARKMLELAEYFDGPYDDKTTRRIKLIELFYCEPWTWENFDILINLIAPVLPFDDPYEITDVNGFEMLDLMFESEQMKVTTACVLIGGELHPNYTGGVGAIGALFCSTGALSCYHPRHGTHSMAHVYIRCFRSLGGKLFNSCPVKEIIIAGGEAKGVILDDHAAFPGKEISATRVVSNLNPRLTFTELVGEEHVGKRVIHQLKTNWKAEGQLLCFHFLLKDRPHLAAEKFDPDLENLIGVGMGVQDLEGIIHQSAEKIAGRVPRTPMVNWGLPHKDDSTQRGYVNAAWTVPYTVYEKGGPGIWDNADFRKELIERHLDICEDHSPGFKDNVLEYWLTTPLDHERINPNYLRGCELGGSYVAPQMGFGNRPGADGFEKGGLVTPITHLYNCGGAGFSCTSGGNGYRAARHITEELNMKNLSWWKHGIGDYISQKYTQKTYVPLKPTSVLDR